MKTIKGNKNKNKNKNKTNTYSIEQFDFLDFFAVVAGGLSFLVGARRRRHTVGLIRLDAQHDFALWSGSGKREVQK